MKNADRVLEYLKAGHTLTAFDGFTKLGIVSVRDYVSMLRRSGVNISSEWRWNADFTKRFKEYTLSKESV
jgi:hypothetical protein